MGYRLVTDRSKVGLQSLDNDVSIGTTNSEVVDGYSARQASLPLLGFLGNLATVSTGDLVES